VDAQVDPEALARVHQPCEPVHQGRH
jgi:hypothetical protein